MTKVITFYSYKGGVGRTMALVNVAHVLARDGWRVLLVDFDLEAPGMTHFFADLVRKRPKSVRYDALDLLLHAKQTLIEAVSEDKPPAFPKSLAPYVISIPLPDQWKDKAIPYRNGRLDLLPATLEPLEPEEAPESEPSREYLRRLDDLDLAGIFAEGGPRHRFGDHVRQYFVNARFQTKGDILFTLRDKVWAAYDLVLIDSRTGLNEVSGLCIGPLCDALVICSGLNRQSIYGTRYFMDKAGLFDRDKAKPYAVVAGPVPVWHTREADKRIDILSRELLRDVRRRPVEIPYHPAAALIEKLFVRDEPNEPITQAYERLAPVVAGLPGDLIARGPEEWATDLSMMRERHEEEAFLQLAHQVAQRLSDCRLREIGSRFPSNGPFASFPTAATLAGLARHGEEDPLWRELAQVPFAAAVSAYRLGSDRPFRHAWKLVPRLAHGDEAERERLGVRLIFMQLSVLGTLPKEDFAREIFDSACAGAKETVEGGRYRGIGDDPLFDILMTLNLLAGRETHWSLHVGHQTILRWTESTLLDGEKSPIEMYANDWPLWQWLDEPPVGSWARLRVETWQALAKGRLDRGDKTKVKALVDRVQLPGPVREVQKQPGRKWSLKFESVVVEHLMFRLRFKAPSWFHAPVGTWLEPLMASAVALLKGPGATEEVIGWLMLSRFFYGYAWRVLVDWRHLESVKDHPAFVEFLREEDELVDEIESAIDRGEYPL